MIYVNVMTPEIRRTLRCRRWRERHSEKAASHSRIWRKANPERARITDRAWRLARIDQIHDYAHMWAKSHRGDLRKRLRAWRLLNPEKNNQYSRMWRKTHPEQIRALVSAWKAANPEKNREYVNNRRARKLGNGGSFTAQQFIDLRAFYGNVCLCCRRTEVDLHAIGLRLVPDHVLPLVKGGLNCIENIQPLCHGKGGCNNRKHTKHVDYRMEIYQCTALMKS